MRVATYSVANPQDERVRVIVSAEIGEAATEAAEWPVGMLVVDKRRTRCWSSNAAPMKLAPASDRTATSRLLLMTVVLEPGRVHAAACGGRWHAALPAACTTPSTRGSPNSTATRCAPPT